MGERKGQRGRKREKEGKIVGRDLSWKGEKEKNMGGRKGNKNKEERRNKNARRKGREEKVFNAKTLHRLTTIESDLPLDSH